MPKWLADLLASFAPTQALVKDMEKLRWEVRTQSQALEHMGAALNQTISDMNAVVRQVQTLAARLTAVESGQVPEFVLTNLRQVRRQLQALLPSDAGLPATATTSGSAIPPAPQSAPLEDALAALNATLPASRAPAGSWWVDGKQVDGPGWRDGQPPV